MEKEIWFPFSIFFIHWNSKITRIRQHNNLLGMLLQSTETSHADRSRLGGQVLSTNQSTLVGWLDNDSRLLKNPYQVHVRKRLYRQEVKENPPLKIYTVKVWRECEGWNIAIPSQEIPVNEPLCFVWRVWSMIKTFYQIQKSLKYN